MAISFAFVMLVVSVSTSALIAPMKTGDGKVDMDSVFNHVLLLEQTVSGLTKKPATCRIQEELKSLKDKLTLVETELNSVKTNLSNRERFISFQVKARPNPTIVNNKEVLKFDTVTLNTRGAYHASTGIFEAPVSGMYLFFANIMSYDGGSLFINLVKEGVTLMTGFSSRELVYGVATMNYVIKVNKGEKVWFTKPGETLKIFGDSYSVYGGVLLRET